MAATDKQISLNSRTRLLISPGEVALALHNNEALFLSDPGVVEFNDGTFLFKKFALLTEKRIDLGSKSRVIVFDGELGISRCNGKIKILQPGKYILDSANGEFFEDFVDVKQISIHLGETKVGSANPSITCETKDFVEIELQAVLFASIEDAEKATKTLGSMTQIQRFLREQGTAQLQAIIRSVSLSQTGQSKTAHIGVSSTTRLEQNPFAGRGISNEFSAPMSSISVPSMSPDNKWMDPPETPPNGNTNQPFFSKLHDEFITALHISFLQRHGVNVGNIRIEQFRLLNQSLSNTISQQALQATAVSSKLANLSGETQISLATEQREAAVNRIKSEGSARKLEIETKAKNDAIMAEVYTKTQTLKMMATAEAESVKIRAEADADAKAMGILKIGQANATATEIQAEAERKRAVALESTVIGSKLAMATLEAEMIGKSMNGLNKIICLPPGMNFSGVPMKMFGMPSGFGSDLGAFGDNDNSDSSNNSSSSSSSSSSAKPPVPSSLSLLSPAPKKLAA